MIGPWLHGRLNKGSEVGELQYPDHAALDIMQHMIQWFDYYLKGRGTEPDTAAPTSRIYPGTFFTADTGDGYGADST